MIPLTIIERCPWVRLGVEHFIIVPASVFFVFVNIQMHTCGPKVIYLTLVVFGVGVLEATKYLLGISNGARGATPTGRVAQEGR